MIRKFRDLLATIIKGVPEISPREVREKMLRGEDFVLLDVREPDEVQTGRLPGALCISRGTLESRIREVLPSKGKPIVVYCQSGARSLLAARALSTMGYADVSSMAGGMGRWGELRYPILKEHQ